MKTEHMETEDMKTEHEKQNTWKQNMKNRTWKPRDKSCQEQNRSGKLSLACLGLSLKIWAPLLRTVVATIIY